MITNDNEWEKYRNIEGGEDIVVTRIFPTEKYWESQRNAKINTILPVPSVIEEWDNIIFEIGRWSPLRQENQKPILVEFLDTVWGQEGRIFDAVADALSLIDV